MVVVCDFSSVAEDVCFAVIKIETLVVGEYFARPVSEMVKM
jgi:hypothetical protein